MNPAGHPLVIAGRILITALAYYAGAWLGVTQTITPEGIAIIWPPNAILLAAFLLFPYRHWPLLAAAALLAECIADVPAFPLWAALAFGLINLFETALAAWLIRLSVPGRFDFDSLKRGGYFLLYGPLVASALAAILGATVYVMLGRSDSSFLSLWRLWWFGDALGLLLLTPLIVVLLRWIGGGGLRRPAPARLLEWALLVGLLIVSGMYTFGGITEPVPGIQLTPVVLLPFGAWAAARFGVRGAALVVVIIAVMAIGFMVRGMHPYTDVSPQFAVWLMQEYLAVVAFLSIGMAILLHEISTQREELEQRVLDRTDALRQSNEALEEANWRLNKLASTDYLTGIANRRYFQQIAARELERRCGGSAPLAMVMLDLDHFKQINDRHGHETGDRVLNSVVSTVKATIRPMDLFGRFGGEEFLILLPDTSLDEAVTIAERIRLQVESMTLEHDGQAIGVTVSLGVAVWDAESPLEDLIALADDALYRAKSAGRNCVKTSLGLLPGNGGSRVDGGQGAD